MSLRDLLEDIKLHPTLVMPVKIDSAQVAADIVELDKGTKKVVRYADRALAHDQKGSPRIGVLISFNEIESAIGVVEKMTKRYIALLTGVGGSSWHRLI